MWARRRPDTHLRTLWRATVALLVAASPASAGTVIAPGGSNFSWFQVDRPQPGVCVREPYGVIPNFNVPSVRAQVEDELGQMYRSGQRRLRIGIFHGRGFDTGTVMDSTGGDLSAQNRRNLSDLLAAVKAAGFIQVEIAFHPEGPAIREWTHWDESRYQENWQLIRNLRPIFRASGLSYRIDLSNEAIPRAGAGQAIMLRYARRLWADYTRAYGTTDTVGFSVIGSPAYVASLRDVYGNHPPPVFDIHFYGGTDEMNEGELFRASDAAMRRLGLVQPWIIGEAFYDDGRAAQLLSDAIDSSSRPVYYLTQWPLTRGSPCADVDVPAPTAFDAYEQAGFGALPVGLAPLPVLATRKLAVDRRGRVGLRIGCARAAAPCSGTVSLRVAGRVIRGLAFSLLPPQTVVRRIQLPAGLSASRGRAVLTAKSLDSPAIQARSIPVALRRV